MEFGRLAPSNRLPLAEINMIPFIDVALVLLTIFMITAHVMQQSIYVDLPKESIRAKGTPEVTIVLSLDASGKIYWNDSVVDKSTLDSLLSSLEKKSKNSVIEIRADKQATYDSLIHLLNAVSNAGLSNVGFVTQPN